MIFQVSIQVLIWALRLVCRINLFKHVKIEKKNPCYARAVLSDRSDGPSMAFVREYRKLYTSLFIPSKYYTYLFIPYGKLARICLYRMASSKIFVYTVWANKINGLTELKCVGLWCMPKIERSSTLTVH